jgi:hypothetical protein
MASASIFNVDIVVDSNLNGIANETKVAIYRMAALNRLKGITRAPQNHKQVDGCAQAPGVAPRNLSDLNHQTPGPI